MIIIYSIILYYIIHEFNTSTNSTCNQSFSLLTTTDRVVTSNRYSALVHTVKLKTDNAYTIDEGKRSATWD